LAGSLSSRSDWGGKMKRERQRRPKDDNIVGREKNFNFKTKGGREEYIDYDHRQLAGEEKEKRVQTDPCVKKGDSNKGVGGEKIFIQL